MQFRILWLFFLVSFPVLGSLPFSKFGELPIYVQGRLKPLDTFARVELTAVSEKSALPQMSAREWLAELIFEKERAWARPVFRIRSFELLHMLNISKKENNLYAFNEISEAFKLLLPTVKSLKDNEVSEKTVLQQQLLSLFDSHIRYWRLSNEMAWLDANSTSVLQVEQSHLEGFSVIPIRRKDNNSVHWQSPLSTFSDEQPSTDTFKLLKLWANLRMAYMKSDSLDWQKTVLAIYEQNKEVSGDSLNNSLMIWERRFNDWDLFSLSLTFYILSFLGLSLSWIYLNKHFTFLSQGLVAFGWLCHSLGLFLRSWIIQRPPVATLYESILFVAWVCVCGSLVYEGIKKNKNGLLVADVGGTILLFLSFGYLKDGDTLGVLEPVLNTNFWLATHVVTITIGYGCCCVLSLLGHLYVFQSYLNKKGLGKRIFDLPDLYKSLVGVTIYSLFFCVLGTFLGGIWADQSWGRFWGWDPKENGAMLICLWLLALLHGRLAGILKAESFAFACVLTSVIVACSWFGVNLLNVGLHSYGFVDGVAYQLVILAVFEILFLLFFGVLTKRAPLKIP